MINRNPNLKKCNPADILKKKQEVNLNMSMASPSLIHTESIATEYIKDFILSGLPKDYFKTVYINEKHILDEYRKMDKSYNFISKPTPAIAITPRINYDFNNNDHNDVRFGVNLAMQMGRLDTSFIKDYDRHLFLALGLKLVELNYNVKIKVDTRSKQVDLFERLGVVLPIGTKRRFKIDLDFHIPLHVMIQFAKDVGFNIQSGDVSECAKFVRYLNSKSELPILYKFRRTNGINEFFVRMRNFSIDIDLTERMSLDDGQTKNHVSDSYMIDFNIGVKIPAPRWYAYYSRTEHEIIHKLSQGSEETVIVGEITTLHIPTVNEKGWNNYLNVDYAEFDQDEIPKIPFIELFDSIHVTPLIRQALKLGISPREFIDIKTFNSDKELQVSMDWETCIGTYSEPFKGITTYIALYLDTEFVHEQTIIMEELNKNRITTDKPY
jgi:hypothetical protein